MSVSRSSNASQNTHTPALITAIGAILAALIGGVFLLIDGEDPPGGTVTPTASTSITDTPDVVETMPVPSISSASPSVTSAQRSAAIPLTLEDALKNESCAWPGNSGFSWKSTAPQLLGDSFARGFSCRFGSDNSMKGELEFAVNGQASRFQSTAGVDTSSENTTLEVRFTVYDAITGNELDTQNATIGSPAKFDVGLDGVNRIGLRTEYLSASESLRDNSAMVSWAEPTFR